eukprot:2750752-Rhodomonas_salina.1
MVEMRRGEVMMMMMMMMMMMGCGQDQRCVKAAWIQQDLESRFNRAGRGQDQRCAYTHNSRHERAHSGRDRLGCVDSMLLRLDVCVRALAPHRKDRMREQRERAASR